MMQFQWTECLDGQYLNVNVEMNLGESKTSKISLPVQN